MASPAALPAESTATDAAVSETVPADRVVSLSTTACGHASGTSGAGVIIEDGWVLASGHVVSAAGSVSVSSQFGESQAEVVVLDTQADLSLLSVPSVQASPIVLRSARSGDVIELAGGGPSAATSASITRPVDVRIEAVRSTERISRVGYEIDVTVQLGDSGGGAFNDDGALVGIIYARSVVREDRSFLVGPEEIAETLELDRTRSWTCDPSRHRIVPES